MSRLKGVFVDSITMSRRNFHSADRYEADLEVKFVGSAEEVFDFARFLINIRDQNAPLPLVYVPRPPSDWHVRPAPNDEQEQDPSTVLPQKSETPDIGSVEFTEEK
jgi:hypothetical protein